ncbi:MAG TPA: hypothetical protein VGR71_01275 [Nitrospira sp.]|nr:hypothetical protein [Nitrospira sp.]
MSDQVFSSLLPDLHDWKVGDLSDLDDDPVIAQAVSAHLLRITGGEMTLSSFNSSI